MFWHSFKYTLKTLVRDRGQMFWCAMFPMVLATLFHFAFGNLSESERFHEIPVAVVLQETNENTMLKETLDQLGMPGEDKMLDVIYVQEEEARRLLEEKKVTGILKDNGTLELTVSAEMTSEKLFQSILKVFVEQYNLSYNSIQDIIKTHPEKMSEVVEALSKEVNYLKEENFTEGNYSEYLTYFFNLIAMACLYASFMGNTIANHHQANLSALGARSAVSPVNKRTSVLGGLAASLVLEYIFQLLSIGYMKYVLEVDFGQTAEVILLVVFVGTMAGISFGFLVGSVGRFSKDVKFGILVAVSMLCCVFSGLMFGQIQIYVNQVSPIINYINPAALISNSLYSLVIYPSHERLALNLMILLAETVLFSFGGLLFIRRKKYASL